MDHTHIVQVADLERYADRRDSQGIIPELIYWLVKQSVTELSVCRIPYGDSVNQPGMDGLVEAGHAFREFVPKGISYWEIGTGGNPQSKATSDFKKRTGDIPDDERAVSAFVFVTPRSSGSEGWDETRQSRWLRRRKDSGWAKISIIDGVKLADWLREFPAIGRWFAKKIGLSSSLSGLSTPAEHWEIIQAQRGATDPPLPEKLFLLGRENACTALQGLFEGRSQRLLFFAESERDVEDFISAYLSSIDEETSKLYGNCCLFISEEDAWRSVVETRKSHVLVADPKLGLESDYSDMQTLATRNGHAVIIPVCGAWSGDTPEIIKLRSPSQSQLESILTEAKFPSVRARELASAGAYRLSALRRHLLGLSALPPYATWENARVIAQAGLIGKWDGKNEADQEALGILLGKEYGEWIERIRPELLRADTPLVQKNEQWRIVARGEAWNALGPQITDDDLERFKRAAVRILGERDPKFELPKDERYAAGIHGKKLNHSEKLREGVAETLALLGSRPKVLSSCSHGKAESIAILTVRELLQDADWERWAGLDHLLPLFAEAAPGEFLDMVESSLENIEESPFHMVFAQEGSGGIGGWNYTSGLLWALEGLAWHPDYLARVILALGELSSIDPGGSWSNRPANSLTDILLPWHIQTCASVEKRKSAVKALLIDQPVVAWNLLISLLPHSHGVTSGCHRPSWRELIPSECKEGVTNKEYFDQVSMYSEMAVELARSDVEKINELIEHLPDLPIQAYDAILDHLASDSVTGLPETDRLHLWENLTRLVRKHRKFADANWAMPEMIISNIEKIAETLKPEKPELLYRYLFTSHGSDLYDEKGNYKEQQKNIDEQRQSALRKILDNGGVSAVIDFSRSISNPYQLGQAFGNIAGDSEEKQLLPKLLDENDDVLWSMVGGYIIARYLKFGLSWVDTFLSSGWSNKEKSNFLVLLPFTEEIWLRADKNLGEDERFYWEKVVANPWESKDITKAVVKLIKYGRANAAVQCLSRFSSNDGVFDPELATRALLAVLDLDELDKDFDSYATTEVITRIQNSENPDTDALYRIEWNFLPLLGRFSTGEPKTLEKRLASDPAFFCEVIGLVFRSKLETKNVEDTTEQQKDQARLAYKLLSEWKIVPGMQPDDSFDEDAFNAWLKEAKRISTETGHYDIAMSQIGQVLTHSPKDPDGLWKHTAVAKVLNAKGATAMRDGFTTELFNQRGVHTFTAGQDEMKLAQSNRKRADELENAGFTRFATSMREFAARYQRNAEYDAQRDPFDD